MSAVEMPTAPVAVVDDEKAGLATETPPQASETADFKQEEQNTTAQNGHASPTDSDYPLSSADGVIKKPFARPLETAKPQPLPELTTQQQTKYEQVLAAVSKWSTIPDNSTKGAETNALTDDERMFLSRDCLLRYLRATKWNVNDAINRIRATLIWRREKIAGKLTPEYISIENEKGKQVILGWDIHARPCLYLLPKNQNTEKSPRQLEHLIFMMERLIDLLPPGQENIALLINFADTKSGQGATVGQAKETLHFLQNHYPERLGRALIVNVPFIIWGFFKIISPFIDPVTRQKLKFNEDLRDHVPPEQLMKASGGDVDFEYDHSIYWPALNKLAEQRRNAYRERWIQGGKRIGENENYLKGGSEPSIGQSEQAKKQEDPGQTAPEEANVEITLENLQVDTSTTSETATGTEATASAGA